MTKKEAKPRRLTVALSAEQAEQVRKLGKVPGLTQGAVLEVFAMKVASIDVSALVSALVKQRAKEAGLEL